MVATRTISDLEYEVLNRYIEDYRILVNDDQDVLCRQTVDLFRYLTELALNRRELDKSRISNYDFKVIAKLMSNGHIALTPEVSLSPSLWRYMTDLLYELVVERTN